FHTTWVPEFGRDFAETNYSHGTYQWRSQDFENIAKEQSRREDDLAGECNKLLICDTDAFATGIWHERYMESGSPVVEAIVNGRPFPYLYLIPEIEGTGFVEDITRYGEQLR